MDASQNWKCTTSPDLPPLHQQTFYSQHSKLVSHEQRSGSFQLFSFTLWTLKLCGGFWRSFQTGRSSFLSQKFLEHYQDVCRWTLLVSTHWGPMTRSPPPQVTEQGESGVSDHENMSAQLAPAPPHTPHLSSVIPDLSLRSHPTLSHLPARHSRSSSLQ